MNGGCKSLRQITSLREKVTSNVFEKLQPADRLDARNFFIVVPCGWGFFKNIHPMFQCPQATGPPLWSLKMGEKDSLFCPARKACCESWDQSQLRGHIYKQAGHTCTGTHTRAHTCTKHQCAHAHSQVRTLTLVYHTQLTHVHTRAHSHGHTHKNLLSALQLPHPPPPSILLSASLLCNETEQEASGAFLGQTPHVLPCLLSQASPEFQKAGSRIHD